MTRTLRVVLAAVAALAAALVCAPDVLAHGVAGREDLPLPKWLFGWSAAAVLVASFVGLAVLWPKARLEEARERAVWRVPLAVEIVCGIIGVALFVVVVWAGLAGAQSQNANFAPYFVLVLFWVGVPLLSVLFGDVFRAFNPWRAIGRTAGWIAKRAGGSSLPEPLPYPDRLGHWPAAVGVGLFATYELVYAIPSDPSSVAVASLVYAALQLVGMSLYGVAAWERHGDGLGVLFRFFGSLSKLDWRERQLWIRPLFSGVAHLRALPGTVALVAVAIGTTTFDGLRENEFWTDLALDIQSALTDVGLSATRGLEVAYLLGMLVIIGLVALLYRLGVMGMHGVDTRHGTEELSRRFVHSLVPVAFAYLIAHYFSLLAFQGQAGVFLASDPLGRGWNVFGMADDNIDYGLVSANGIWYVQVAALVLGHVAGLILAHDRALVVFQDVKRATRSQYWMLAVMVAFTSIGLWLLSSLNA